MAALTVEYLPLDTLVPYERNSRTHTDAQIQAVAASIREFSFTNPVLIDADNGIIAGHCRAAAARLAGLERVPCIRLGHLTKTQKRALIIADNRLALSAGWSDELLRMELTDLQTDGFDLDLTGFSGDELADLLALAPGEGLTDPDAVPEPEREAVTRHGDVWIMGRHRLRCGDSTQADDIAALMQGAEADLCFTSPPYGQQRDYKGGIGDWDALMQGVFAALPVRQDAQVLVNLGMIHRDGEWLPYWDGWVEWMRSQGWRRFGWYVWDQGPGLPGDWSGRLAPSHEFIFHFNRVAERARKTKAKKAENIKLKGGTGIRRADGTMSGVSSPEKGLQASKIPDSVVRVMRHKCGLGDAGNHPAVFPVDLVSEMLTAFSDPDDIVFEPFCGSGTQLLSAQKNGRSCFAMEIAPVYADVAVRRWQNFSGQFATLEGDGRSFDDISAERVPVAQAAE
jgi:DNA modification methylase